MNNSDKTVFLGSVDETIGADTPSFDNPPKRIKITQREYNAFNRQSESRMDYFVQIPDNCDLSNVKINSSKPHQFLGNNLIPGDCIPDGSVVGAQCKIRSNAVLNDVVIGHSTELGDSILLDKCRVDDYVTMGSGVVLENTRLGNGVIVSEIESIKNCEVGYNFDAAIINEIGPGNVFQRDMYVESVGSTHENNLVKTVSNTTEPLNIDDYLPTKDNVLNLNAN